uniref:C2H2-type domain-containing protein n=1 Tax=Pectinophora gossypiella TaxID=13191 RepID=A0A1E1WJI5_PECGO
MTYGLSFVLENYEMRMARRNAQLILEHATAYPFRLPEGFAVCVYCNDRFEDPSVFRKHMDDEHTTFKIYIAFAHIHEGYIKADVTDLRCRLCQERSKSLEEIAQHLNSVHDQKINFEFDLGIQPYTIERDKWVCAMCDTKFNNLRSLSRHTAKHFVKFTCDSCGKSYSTSAGLNHHIMFSHISDGDDKRFCRKCRTPCSSSEELRKHMESSKKCCQHVCNTCGERFATWTLKQTHLTESHSAPKKKYPCPECGQVFENAEAGRVHFKISHTNDHFQCSCCGRKFVTEYKLKRHMVSHTGEKEFECSVCFKAFPRKSTLDQHMWIHRAVKKWKCVACDKQFNQKVSWKTHMKAHHPEIDL